MPRVPLFGNDMAATAIEQRVFFREERQLRPAASRHLDAARILAGHESQLMEAMFHARLSAECLLKHLFCLVRFVRGAYADTPADFVKLVLPKDEYRHNVKQLGVFLLKQPELVRSKALERLVRLFPGGEDWNIERYAAATKAADAHERFAQFFEALQTLVTDVDEGVMDA